MNAFIRLTSTAGVLLLAAAAAVQPLSGSPQARAQAPASPAAQNPPAAAPADPGRGAGGPGRGQGRGGGRGNPVAALYDERCAPCHGTTTQAGRAQSLFDDQWTRARDDEGIAAVIAQGVPQTEMIPFKDLLTDQQIWQLVAYLRNQAANLKPRPQFVADPDGQVITSEKQKFKIEVLARELETPWGLAFLPDGRLLITERPGRLRIYDKGRLLPAVTGTPKVWERQDGGMFDVEVHPQYAKNGWIYLSYSVSLPGAPAAAAAPATPAQGGRGGQPPSPPSMTVIVRGKINTKNEWVDQQFIYEPPKELFTANNSHYGSRFTFDRQGHLFYSIGERGEPNNAQSLSNPLGKVHRVNDDGSIPKDNPFVGKEGAVASIWSYGHRNPQGFAWDPVSSRLWESEHGPQGGDELNIIEPGKNYGWGVITHGIQNGITKRAEPGMEQPIVYYTPTIAPSGMVFYTGNRFPGWRNSLFLGGMAGQQLRRIEIAGDKVTHQEVVFSQFGRVRDIAVGSDGHMYVLLQTPGQPVSASTPGLLVRLIPQ
jgi:glucose/arabinose dehydrogenase